MTSLMASSVVLFLCWVIIAQCRAKGLPIHFVDLSAILNGNYDNVGQIKDGDHDRISAKWKPVLIPGLQKDPAIYIEENVNGHVYRRSILVRNKSSTDSILYISYYNFTDSSQHGTGPLNTDALANLTREDFRIDEGCQASYTMLFPGVLFGQVLDCRHVVNGKHPIYTIHATCDNLRFESPLASDETTSRVAYDLKQIGPRYPLIDPPDGYVNPCQDGL